MLLINCLYLTSDVKGLPGTVWTIWEVVAAFKDHMLCAFGRKDILQDVSQIDTSEQCRRKTSRAPGESQGFLSDILLLASIAGAYKGYRDGNDPESRSKIF